MAEADVYIAYGRDAQAEEILKEALRIHPERYPVRLKLLEIYAARKDQRAFETQASQMYSLTHGQGDEWAQAVALGMSIDPLNPLYAKSRASRPGRLTGEAASRRCSRSSWRTHSAPATRTRPRPWPPTPRRPRCRNWPNCRRPRRPPGRGRDTCSTSTWAA